jgi:hypothetical protein
MYCYAEAMRFSAVAPSRLRPWVYFELVFDAVIVEGGGRLVWLVAIREHQS